MGKGRERAVGVEIEWGLKNYGSCDKGVLSVMELRGFVERGYKGLSTV